MLEVDRGGVNIAVVGDGGAREVEGAAVESGDNFDGVGIVDLGRSAAHF